VIRDHVERFEVEPVVFDLGAFGDLVAHGDEDVDEPVGEHRDRVAGAGAAAVDRQRDVDPLLDEHSGVTFGDQFG
jgi:hypothetical protein